MFSLTVHVPSVAHGTLTVEAEIEKRAPNGAHYHIGTVCDALGRSVECTPDLLDEIETSIDFEMQCARYEALFFESDSPYLAAVHA